MHACHLAETDLIDLKYYIVAKPERACVQGIQGRMVGGLTKGQVLTPPLLVDLMVEKLFRKRPPRANDRILDAGCGEGAFIKGILNWCHKTGTKAPQIIGVESDPQLFRRVQESFKNHKTVTLINQDFLLEESDPCNFIIGNPPYVRIEGIKESRKKIYREKFSTAKNRFDLYILFFEKALSCLAPSGRLVFVTPEKFEYTLTAKPLRALMTNYHIEEIHHIDESVFPEHVAYPAITTIDNTMKKAETTIIQRDGSRARVLLPSDGSSWISSIRNQTLPMKTDVYLEEICRRISCGVATGRDKIFVIPANEVPEGLKPFSHPTISGRQITANGATISDRILVPYDSFGHLIPEEMLGELTDYLRNHKKDLESRYCVAEGKRKWYAFHENPPMEAILNPKIICRDITKEPLFWLDREGDIVPRHSVYYITPKNPKILPDLFTYLKSENARNWLLAHCQRAANNFIRLQSNTLKKMPVPQDLSFKGRF